MTIKRIDVNMKSWDLAQHIAKEKEKIDGCKQEAMLI